MCASTLAISAFLRYDTIRTKKKGESIKMSTHHTLDVHPIPEKVLFVNETQLADPTELPPGSPSDNIRIYIPLDLNHDAILRRLNGIYRRYGELTESNEFSISSEVYNLISQIEIYDQVWFVREGNYGNKHSQKATKLVKEVVKVLMENEGSGETFPYELADELSEEYGLRK